MIQCDKEKARGTAKNTMLTDIFSVISNRLQKFFGGGWSNDLMARKEGFEFYSAGKML